MHHTFFFFQLLKTLKTQYISIVKVRVLCVRLQQLQIAYVSVRPILPL